MLPFDERFEDDKLLVKISATCIEGHNDAVELEQALGWEMVPPRIPTSYLFPRLDKYKAGSTFLQRWVRGAKKLDPGYETVEGGHNTPNPESLAQVCLFEYLLEKPDAHDGNRVVAATGRVWSIDHDTQWGHSWYGSWSQLYKCFPDDSKSAVELIKNLLHEIESHKLDEESELRREKIISSILGTGLLP